MQTFFSIIVTSYNKQEYVKSCIESVLGQTFKDFELIFVDDLSDDESVKIAENFADNRLKVYKNNTNLGVSYSRNFGLQNSCGKYILFVDVDDRLEPQILENAYKSLSKNPSQMLVFPYSFYYRDTKKTNSKNRFQRLFYLEKLPSNFLAQNATKELCSMNYEVWNKIFQREFLIENSIKFCEELSFGEDMVFYAQVLANLKTCAKLNQKGYLYTTLKKKPMENFIWEGKFLQFKKSMQYSQKILEKTKFKKHFEERQVFVLNWWLMKLRKKNDVSALYNFAKEFCPKARIVNVFSIFDLIFFTIYLKILQKL